MIWENIWYANLYDELSDIQAALNFKQYSSYMLSKNKQMCCGCKYKICYHVISSVGWTYVWFHGVQINFEDKKII